MWDDGRNRAVKEALRKNSVQQSVYDSTSRSLDAERRSLESRRVREEGAPRAQHRRSMETRRVREEGAPRAQHRRSLETRRVREEGELRAQLRRLQLEQRVHSELDNSGETICTGVTNAKCPIHTDRKTRQDDSVRVVSGGVNCLETVRKSLNS